MIVYDEICWRGIRLYHTLVYLSIILKKTDFLKETVCFVSPTVTNCKEVTKTSNIPTDQKGKKNIK